MEIVSTFEAKLGLDLFCLRRNQTAGMIVPTSLGVQQRMVTRPPSLDSKVKHFLQFTFATENTLQPPQNCHGMIMKYYHSSPLASIVALMAVITAPRHPLATRAASHNSGTQILTHLAVSTTTLTMEKSDGIPILPVSEQTTPQARHNRVFACSIPISNIPRSHLESFNRTTLR
jgi:hypothetical protein